MVGLALGFIITLISLLIGFSLGRHEKPLPPKVQEQLKEIFKKKIADPLVNDRGVGAVSRPTQDQIDRWNNPKLAQEEAIMNKTFEELNKNG